MKEILLFAGTTEGRILSETLAEAGICHTVCVATEYGGMVLKNTPLVKVSCRRLDREGIKELLQSGNFIAVVDATHPYAQVVSCNIKAAMEGMEIPYLRMRREGFFQKGDMATRDMPIMWFDTDEICAKELEKVEGKILLTVGSKALFSYCSSEAVRKRLFIRVLPSVESLSFCMEQGISGQQIIAMQGPFTLEMNMAMIRQYGISCLVTKESGTFGGFWEKLEAARKTGIQLFVIGRPKEEEGYFFSELCGELEKICGRKLVGKPQLEIVLAGVGMGHPSSLTKEVQDAIDKADVLLGAERLLLLYPSKQEKYPYYQAEQIIPYLKEIQTNHWSGKEKKVVVLFSGDSGFYSGCQALYTALKTEIDAGTLSAKVKRMAGISSIAYLASCIGESYQDAAIYSMHGKELCNLIHKINCHSKVFLLLSGVQDVNRLGALLIKANLTECQVIIGYQLSYQEQRIQTLTPQECCEQKELGLYTCLIKNPYACPRKLTHGIADLQFISANNKPSGCLQIFGDCREGQRPRCSVEGSLIRNKVPMTKEEVREVSICKLQLYQKAVVYDIGSGTGSIAVEIARLSDEVQVYAIEQKKEAIFLMEQNKEKFQLQNITIVEATAPEGLMKLPAATHALIGGSGGKIREILDCLYQINAKMRIVIHAISLETISEIREILSAYPIGKQEVLQLQISRARQAGKYHLMQAENPVWICVFEFMDCIIEKEDSIK